MVVARAPVRISFGGGGTDLAAYYARFGGLVCSAAITRYSYVVASPSADGSTTINSSDYRTWVTFPRGSVLRVEEPLALARAAIEWFVLRGMLPSGVDMYLNSEVSPGTGLGSSSAMAVALSHALSEHAGGRMLDASAAAEIACELEIERLHMPIGKQDQYASAFGGLNMIEFSSNGVTVTPLRLPADTVAALSSSLLLFATGSSRDSAGILRQQRADTSSNPAVIESLHQIKELATAMHRALEHERLDEFGHLLHRAWQHKRSLSSKVSTRAIDQWYEAACDAGALGGKITGAGGGGFLLLYCPPRRRKAVREAMIDRGLRDLPFGFDFEGARVLPDALTDHKVAIHPREAVGKGPV